MHLAALASLPTLRSALLGCGRIGTRHAALMHDLGILSAVVDTDLHRARQLGETYGVPAYASLEQLIQQAETELLAICTPSGLHAMQSIAALRAGMHVLCEKPMALRSEDARAMVQASETYQRRLFIVKQNRFNPPVRLLRELILAGRLGRLLDVQVNCFWHRGHDYFLNSWHGDPAMAGGALYTQFSHFVDLLFWLFGDMRIRKAEVRNLMHPSIPLMDDQGVVLMEWPGGMTGLLHYSLNAFGKNMEGSITVFGEKGTIKIGGEYLNELSYQCLEGDTLPELPSGNPPNQYGRYTGSMSNHRQVYENVLEVCMGRGEIATGGEEGLKTVAWIEEAYRLAKTDLT